MRIQQSNKKPNPTVQTNTKFLNGTFHGYHLAPNQFLLRPNRQIGKIRRNHIPQRKTIHKFLTGLVHSTGGGVGAKSSTTILRPWEGGGGLLFIGKGYVLEGNASKPASLWPNPRTHATACSIKCMPPHATNGLHGSHAPLCSAPPRAEPTRASKLSRRARAPLKL